MNIGLAIRTLRQSRGWVQEELAFRCNTTGATISRIEQGKAQPSFTMLKALAQGFGMEMFQLVAHAEGATQPQVTRSDDPMGREALQHFEVLTTAQKRAVLDLMRTMTHPASR